MIRPPLKPVRVKPVAVPLLQTFRIGLYVLRQHFSGVKRYPLVLMMEPLFRMYVDELLPVNKYRTKHYFGLDDAAYYIECIHFWGDVFNESYGWQPMKDRKDPLQQSGYHKWEWVAGPELVYMMLDAYEYTGDVALLKKRILPTAGAVLRFFDGYYNTN